MKKNTYAIVLQEHQNNSSIQYSMFSIQYSEYFKNQISGMNTGNIKGASEGAYNLRRDASNNDDTCPIYTSTNATAQSQYVLFTNNIDPETGEMTLFLHSSFLNLKQQFFREIAIAPTVHIGNTVTNFYIQVRLIEDVESLSQRYPHKLGISFYDIIAFMADERAVGNHFIVSDLANFK